MADTIAVMNAGRIEQLGDPASIYELPKTVFVANFLGQSNLFAGTRMSSDSQMIEVMANGIKFLVPVQRNSATGDEIIVGIRPEKMTVLDLPDRDKIPVGNNSLDGRVVDVSYAGVSTQYLITLPWGQNITVFEQNVIVGDRSSVGDEVLVHWAPEHTFGLAGGETLLATTAQAMAAGA
jgi:spermidine/putrescine transport system ATP-binding protein